MMSFSEEATVAAAAAFVYRWAIVGVLSCLKRLCAVVLKQQTKPKQAKPFSRGHSMS